MLTTLTMVVNAYVSNLVSPVGAGYLVHNFVLDMACIGVARGVFIHAHAAQYMIMGHAAGVAAAQAIHKRKAVQDIDVATLQKRLREQKQVLSMEEAVK